jgi:hypothetical protein
MRMPACHSPVEFSPVRSSPVRSSPARFACTHQPPGQPLVSLPWHARSPCTGRRLAPARACPALSRAACRADRAFTCNQQLPGGTARAAALRAPGAPAPKRGGRSAPADDCAPTHTGHGRPPLKINLPAAALSPPAFPSPPSLLMALPTPRLVAALSRTPPLRRLHTLPPFPIMHLRPLHVQATNPACPLHSAGCDRMPEACLPPTQTDPSWHITEGPQGGSCARGCSLRAPPPEVVTSTYTHRGGARELALQRLYCARIRCCALHGILYWTRPRSACRAARRAPRAASSMLRRQAALQRAERPRQITLQPRAASTQGPATGVSGTRQGVTGWRCRLAASIRGHQGSGQARAVGSGLPRAGLF